MRVQPGALLRYVATNPPDNPKDLPAFLREELAKIQFAFGELADGQLDVTTVAPAKPRDGMIRYTNAVSWNPGAGRGFYGYDNGAWKLLG